MGFPLGSVVKNSPANARDMGLTPKSGRSPGIGNGNPLQYFCLGDPMDRMEEPGGLQSTVLQKSHNLTTVIQELLKEYLGSGKKR